MRYPSHVGTRRRSYFFAAGVAVAVLATACGTTVPASQRGQRVGAGTVAMTTGEPLDVGVASGVGVADREGDAPRIRSMEFVVEK